VAATPPLDPTTLKRLLDHAAVAVILGDASGAILYASRPAGRLLARPAEALLGQDALALVAPDRRAAFAAKWKEASEGSTVTTLEIEILRADGQASLAEIDLLPAVTPSGTGVQWNLRPLAALKAAQEQTEETAVALAKERRAQGAFVGILKLLNESTDPRSITRVGLTDTAKAVGAQLGLIYTLDSPGRSRLAARYAPGESAAPSASARPAESETVRDLVARVTAERRTAIVTPVPDGADLTIRTGSWEKPPHSVAAFPLLFREEVLGVLLLAALRPFAPEDLRLIELLSNQIAFALSNARSLHRARAMAEELAEKNRRLRGQSDELLRKSEEIFSQDIALLKQTEELGKIEKLKLDFLDKMSRELRTPLNRMIGHLISVLTNGEETMSPESVEHLRAALGDGTAFSRTLSNLVDLWRIKEGQLPPDFKLVQFEAVVDEAAHHVAQLARERGVEVIKNLDGVMEPIRTDLAKLTQIMTEVIGNAVKFTTNGTVTISAETEDGRLLCQVNDTGMGIAPDDLEHVYDEFYQVDESGDRGFHGAGLGLSIAKQFTTLLHGTIAVASEIGEGTTVTLTFPLNPASVAGSAR
jgi:PAS domain S-box-containing protein